ncbi:Wound-induced protein WIN2 [Linum perenne]
MSPPVFLALIILFCFSASNMQSCMAEREDFRCFYVTPTTGYGCKSGRCCSIWDYCSEDPHVCNSTFGQCQFQCTSSHSHQSGPLPLATTLDDNNNMDTLINATTYNNNMISRRTCATSLINIPHALLHKYDWAAFRHSAIATTSSSSSTCGQCLKLKSVKSGTEATVRIVHERTTDGLELNSDTFDKLSAKDDDKDHLVLKYNLTSCED